MIFCLSQVYLSLYHGQAFSSLLQHFQQGSQKIWKTSFIFLIVMYNVVYIKIRKESILRSIMNNFVQSLTNLEQIVLNNLKIMFCFQDWFADHNAASDGEHLQLGADEHPRRGGRSDCSCSLDCLLHHLCLSLLPLICLHSCQDQTINYEDRVFSWTHHQNKEKIFIRSGYLIFDHQQPTIYAVFSRLHHCYEYLDQKYTHNIYFRVGSNISPWYKTFEKSTQFSASCLIYIAYPFDRPFTGDLIYKTCFSFLIFCAVHQQIFAVSRSIVT